ncbi:translation initiation factor IF-2 [Arcobacter sp. 15-2]|uniref:translation initiation factor IF-2 n=1 Tax=Arcobacter sp. 15-2 TaxID=3374109 RepID=UPI00399C848D
MEDKVRVFEIAEEAGSTSAEVIKKAADLAIVLKSPQSSVSFEEAEEIAGYIMTGKSKLLVPKKAKPTIKKAVSEKVEEKKEEVVPTKATEIEKKVEVKKPEAKKMTLKRNELKIVQKKNVPVEEKKPEEPILETKEVEVTKETPKEVETVQEAPKEVKETPIVQAPEPEKKITLKKRGLTIVKKKRPIIENTPATPQSKKQKLASMSELFGGGSDLKEEYTPRPKKVKAKQAAKAHTHGTKLKVESDDDFKSSGESILGEEVVLLDMGLMETSKFLQETPKPKNIRTTKPSAFGNQPRGIKRGSKKKRYKKPTEEVVITEVTIPEDCRVYEFAEKIGKTAGDVIGKLFMLGMMVTKNDFLGNDEIEILGEEYNIEITIKDELEDVNYVEDYAEEEIDKTNYVSRPPVVTIMGHVDHGKTSLLDKIRSSRVAAGEAGGITQHISAYTVNKNGNDITFVDTPGHEAFTSMRVRGASVTDIIILVVAADDGVKPQTIESIKAAKASGAPIIVAVNKIDKETANMDMVKAGMAEHEMSPVDWGGDVEFIGVSALTGEGIEELLENIIIQSELLELEADPTALAKATVIEALQVKGKGAVATVIVQNGTLKVGDNIVADTTFGRVKALLDDQGKAVKELGLSRTGQVVGLGDVPITGSALVAQKSASEAKEIATTRAEHSRAKELSASTKVSLDEMAALIAEGKIKALPVILKADAGGSLEAIKASLESIKNDEVKVKIISSGVGGITEADIALASASDDCIILGFNVRPTGAVKTKAKSEGVEIKTYSIIYALLDDIKATLSGMMSAIVVEENTGQAQVLETFVVPKVGTVAGCKVTDGKVVRGGLARVIRDGVVIYTGAIKSLKRFKDDVKEVTNGYECGIIFENHNDIKQNDYIETFIEHKEEQKID